LGARLDKPGRNDTLTGLDQLSADDAWAVGWHAPEYARIRSLVMHWDGSTWSKIPVPQPGKTHNGLSAVAAVSADDVWALGSWSDTYDGFSSNLAEHWDGTSWSVVPTPDPGAAHNGFEAVAAVASDDVWAVGGADPDFDGGQAPEVEHWDGSAWTVVDVPALPGGGFFTDVSASASDEVWVVGHARIGQRDVPVAEHFDGAHWVLVSTPKLHKQGGWFQSVTTLSPTNAWAVGAWTCKQDCVSQTLVEHWDGLSWTVVRSPSPGNRVNELFDIHPLASDDIWAVGGWTSKSEAGTLAEHWDGTRWSVSATPAERDEARLLSVDAVSPTQAFSVGFQTRGTALKNLGERWNGVRWRRVPIR
jgi:hypothetical protein